MGSTFDEIYLEFYAEKGRLMWGEEPSPGVVMFSDFLKRKKMYAATILDSGCGEGRNSIYLAKQGFRVYGLDISSVAINRAKEWAKKENLSGRVHFDVGDVSKMKFRDNFFDAAIDINTMNFVRDKKAYVAELSRVLKPEGYLLLEVLSEKNRAHGLSRDELEWILTPHFKIVEFDEFSSSWEGIQQHQYRLTAKNR